MKRGILIFVIAILLTPLSLADVSVNVLGKNEFNLGDTIKLSGTLSSDEALTGFLLLSIVCNDNKFSLQPVKFKLNANEEKSFPIELNVPVATATLGMVGKCYAMAELMVDNEIIENALSQEFEVKKSLRGSFTPNDFKVQLGQSFSVNGIIQKLDGSPLDGKAEVYFNHDNINYLVKIIDIVNGELKFDYNPDNMRPGLYEIEIIARDINGNNEKFSAAKFELTDQLYVYATTDKTEYEPGEVVKINAEANNINQQPAKVSTAYVSFNNKDYSAKVEDNKISYNLELPEDIKSGEHIITVTVYDDEGNNGNAVSDIMVKQIPTRLELELSSNMFEPEDIVTIKPKLYDQANDLVDSLVELKIVYDKEEIFSSLVPNNQNSQFQLPKHSEPGEWNVVATHGELEAESMFTVKEVTGLAASVTGNFVNIKNTGNVKFKDKLNFKLKNDQDVIDFKQKLNLEPGEVEKVALNEIAPTGNYVLDLPLPDGEKNFEVSVTDGVKKSDLSLIFPLITLLLVVSVVYLASVYLPKKVKKKADHKTFAKAAKKVYQKRDELKKEEVEKLNAIEDFKQQTLKEIRKVEEKEVKEKSKPSWLRNEQKPVETKKDDGFNNASGFFNNF